MSHTEIGGTGAGGGGGWGSNLIDFNHDYRYFNPRYLGRKMLEPFAVTYSYKIILLMLGTNALAFCTLLFRAF